MKTCATTLGATAGDLESTTRALAGNWAAIFFSNTLGTAFGDYLQDDYDLGFLGTSGLIAGLLTTVLLVHYRVNGINYLYP